MSVQLRAGRLSSAAFLKQQGWGVGTVLAGGPIMHEGREIERPMQARITAVGESSVLARSRSVGEGPGWAAEMGLSFDARDWTLLEAAEAHVVTTFDELHALLPGSIVRDVDGDAWQLYNLSGYWYGSGTQLESPQLIKFQPLTILFTPEVTL